jgi:transposase
VDRLYVGIDVAQETLEVTVLDGLGNVVASSTSYPNTPEGHDELWSDTQALCHRLHLPIAYAMEASGIYHVDLLYFLVEQRADVWSFNPLLLKEEKGGSLRKTKTDPIDARRIAEYARTKGHKRPFATWNETDKRLRERCRIRHRIVEKASDSQRQLHRDLDLLVPGLTGTLGRLDHPSSLAACLAIFQQTKFPEVSQEEVERALKPFYTRTELVAPKAQRIAERLQACRPAGGMVEPLIDEVKFLVREIELFQEQIRQEEGRIAREMETRDSRLLTVPGVGPVVAAVVASELGDPQRFSRVEEVVAFAGLDSSKKLSGKFEGRFTPISKRGPPAIRESVYNAAMVASRVEPVSKEFFERLRGKGKAYKVAMVALARRILIWCWVVLRDGVAWDANRARPHAQRVKDLGKSQPA